MGIFQELSTYFLQIIPGWTLTLKIFFITLIISMPLGAVIALLRLSKIKVVNRLMSFYIWVLRGTPLLLQLIFIFFGLPEIGIKFGRLTAVYIAFGLNYAAYFGEIFRSGIQSIERGQKEAATILGLNVFQIQTKIVLPQVLKRTLPAIGNEIITLVKDTSLAHVLAITEILKLATGLGNKYASLTPYLVAGVIYLFMTYIVPKILEVAEKKVNYEE